MVLAMQTLFIYLGGALLRTAPLLPREIMLTLALATLVFPAELLRKIFLRIIGAKKGF